MPLPRGLLVAVALLGVLLVGTAIPAPFTIDENNYLVTVLGLRQGRLTVPGTEGLPASPELLYFDPAAIERKVTSTPVVSTVPPLYAVLALPFSYAGWRGLVALNAVALLATVVIAFLLARRFSPGSAAPWLAAFAVAAGSYFYEYGQGVWPHMVTTALVAGGVYLAARALDERPMAWAAGAGFLAAAAAGVRYQNAFVLGCIGLALLLLGRARLRAAASFALGALPPLAASAFMNHSRLGSWNPISKGPGYLPAPGRIGASSNGFFADFLVMGWARIVDYSAIPPLTGTVHESFHTPHPVSGAFVMVTAVKKAWLQSSPWMIVALLLLVLAWLPQPTFARWLGGVPQRPLRLLSLVVLPTLAMFSASGVGRTDGLCFNQRYFCELVPLTAIAFAWGVEGVARRRPALLTGALVGAVLGVIALMPHPLMAQRHYMVMYIPLALAALLAAAWALELAARLKASAHTSAAFVSVFLAVMVGASLTWATTLHLGDDLKAARILRLSRQDYLRQLRPYLEGRSAVFASGGIKDALGPLQLEQDVVIAVPGLDHAATTKALLEAFLDQGRRVYFIPNVLPVSLLDSILEGKKVRYLGRLPLLIEVGAGSS